MLLLHLLLIPAQFLELYLICIDIDQYQSQMVYPVPVNADPFQISVNVTRLPVVLLSISALYGEIIDNS